MTDDQKDNTPVGVETPEKEKEPEPQPVEKKKDEKSNPRGRSTPAYEFQPRGWYERDGIIYLTTIDRDKEKFAFVFYKDNVSQSVDSIIVREPVTDDDEVVFSGKKIIPRSPPKNKDGEFIDVVGIPDTKEVMSAKDITSTELMDAIVKHIKTYCDMTDLDTRLCAYYVLMTWFYPKLKTLPYLRFRADTGKGKSRILRVVSGLTLFPVYASGASSAAGIIRFNETWHGTLVVDEADLKGEADDSGGYTNDMIKYLNLGFERGQYFLKADRNNPREQEAFDPFCPKIIAMRGSFHDPATEGRCLSISPSETERKDIHPVLPEEYYSSTSKLRALLVRFVTKNWNIITDADPYPSFSDLAVEPRLKQLGSPMARVLSKVLPDGITEFRQYLEMRQQEIRFDRSMSFPGQLSNAVYECATDPENNNGCVSISDVKDRIAVSSNRISRSLKECGFEIIPMLVNYSKRGVDGVIMQKRMTVKTVRVKDQRTWREICSRYILPKTGQASISSDYCDCPEFIRDVAYVEN